MKARSRYDEGGSLVRQGLEMQIYDPGVTGAEPVVRS